MPVLVLLELERVLGLLERVLGLVPELPERPRVRLRLD